MTPKIPRVDRDDDGHPVWVHVCPAAGPEFTDPIRATLPLGVDGWQWTGDGGLVPSILCGCGVHGFWIGGEHPHWQPC